MQDLVEQLLVRLALKRPPLGQHLVQHHAQRPEVRSPVQAMGLAADLLRGHVGRSARHFARVEPLALIVDRQTEIGHVRIAVGVQQHVRRFQIPVHQARGVGVLDRRRHLQHDLPHAVRSELVGFQFLLQRVTFDVLEHDKGAAVFLTPHVVHAHNRRVLLQAGDVTSLLQQTLDMPRPRQTGPGARP